MHDKLHEHILEQVKSIEHTIVEQEKQWQQVISSIKSPSFAQLALFIKPKVTKHPFYSFYQYFLDGQLQQYSFPESFWDKLYHSEYLILDNEENLRFQKMFYDNIEKTSLLFVDFLDYYLEYNKPFFIGGLNTTDLISTHNYIKSKVLQYFSASYKKHMYEYHHLVNEDNQEYLFTNKRFFPSYYEINKIFDSVNECVEQELYSQLTPEQFVVVGHMYQCLFQNESYLQKSFFFLMNVFNEECSLENMVSLLDKDMHIASYLNIKYFSKEMEEKYFQNIQSNLDLIYNKFNLRCFYNPMILEHKGEKTLYEQTPVTTLNFISALFKHLEEINKCFPYNQKINEKVICGTHIPYCFNDVLPLACFTHIFRVKMINCNFWNFHPDETEIFVHEYQHLLDNVFLETHVYKNKIIEEKFFHLSSTFPVEFQQIFLNNNELRYKKTLFDDLSGYAQSAYSKLFENFLFSITSKFEVSSSHVIDNQNRLMLVEKISSVLEEKCINHLMHNFSNLLNNTTFSDPYYTDMAQEINSFFFNEGKIRHKIYEYLCLKFRKGILPSLLSYFTPDGLSILIDDFSSNFDSYIIQIHQRSIYEKELFLIPLKNDEYQETIKLCLFIDLLNLNNQLINKITSTDEKFLHLFALKDLNVNSNPLYFLNEEDFTYNFSRKCFSDFCKNLTDVLHQSQTKIENIILENNIDIDIISVSTDSNFERLYLPVPNIFNDATLKSMTISSVDRGIYLNYPSEILARSSASIFNLRETINSLTFHLLKGKDIISSKIDKSDYNHTITEKDFSKETYQHIYKNYKDFIFLLGQSIKQSSLKKVELELVCEKDDFFQLNFSKPRQIKK